MLVFFVIGAYVCTLMSIISSSDRIPEITGIHPVAAKERLHIRENNCMLPNGGTVTNMTNYYSLETRNILKNIVHLAFQFVVIRSEKHLEPGEFLFLQACSSLIKSRL